MRHLWRSSCIQGRRLVRAYGCVFAVVRQTIYPIVDVYWRAAPLSMLLPSRFLPGVKVAGGHIAIQLPYLGILEV